MGRKSVSKGMPKKSRPFSNADIRGSLKVNPGKSLSEHPLVKDEEAPLNKGAINPSKLTDGSNKDHKNDNDS